MSYQSQQLLTLPSIEVQKEFIDYIMSISRVTVPLSNVQTTCISTIPHNLAQNSCVDVIIVGTEQGSIYFIDTQAYNVLKHVKIAGIPVKILPTGVHNFFFLIFRSIWYWV